MRIGIFGGTFDPVHIGHLIIAEQAREQARLDRVWFVPSARPPHKQDQALTPFDRRVDMLQLALAGQVVFQVELLERDRPGPSYTVDTLADLHRLHPHDEFFLIVGGDCLPDFPTWREPHRILEQATLLVAARPGFPVWSRDQLAAVMKLSVNEVRLAPIEIPLLEISSRDLRQRAAKGQSILYMVPRAVEVYIREKGIYIS